MFELETERVSLRPVSEADTELYCEIFMDEDTMRYVGPPLSRQRAVRAFRTALRLTRRVATQRLFFAASHRESGQRIGICSLQQIDPVRRRAEVGVMLRAGARAHGLGRELLVALTTRAFAIFPIEEVWIQSSAGHLVAERVALGAGLSRRCDPADYGHSPDKAVWSVSRVSWARARSEFSITTE